MKDMVERYFRVKCDICGKVICERWMLEPFDDDIKGAGGIINKGKVYCGEECLSKDINEEKYLTQLEMDAANRILSKEGKERWCRVHNATANLYYVKDGEIKEVEHSGWWR